MAGDYTSIKVTQDVYDRLLKFRKGVVIKGLGKIPENIRPENSQVGLSTAIDIALDFAEKALKL